jgi:hypothetical protein
MIEFLIKIQASTPMTARATMTIITTTIDRALYPLLKRFAEPRTVKVMHPGPSVPRVASPCYVFALQAVHSHLGEGAGKLGGRDRQR